VLDGQQCGRRLPVTILNWTIAAPIDPKDWPPLAA
jgi:hypothetical protein